MSSRKPRLCTALAAFAFASILPEPGFAESGKLLLTGGVTQIEGSAGGGLTPWAVIGGYGTRDQIGANAFYTDVRTQDYGFRTTGALVGLYDRVELSYARQAFDTRSVGRLLGLGSGFKFHQDVFGVKIKLAGDAVLEQDSWLPQIAFGVQHKRNDRGTIVRAVGAKDDIGTDFYLSATKLFLDQSLLVNTTIRETKANQLGILGFGGDKNDRYSTEIEGSVAYLLRRDLAIGAEYRSKPDNLRVAEEHDWYDLFIAWAPLKNASVTLAYTNLGRVVDVAAPRRQHGLYASVQIGF